MTYKMSSETPLQALTSPAPLWRAGEVQAEINPAPAAPGVNLDTADIRFIRLGRGGCWAQRAIESGDIPLDYREASHDLALAGDVPALSARFRALGQTPGSARRSAREVLAFYELAPGRVWVTCHAGRLWWAHAEPEVIWTGDASYGARMRRVVGAWRATDALGRELHVDRLSSALTKMRRYRRTLCPAPRALLDLIKGESADPLAEAIASSRAALETAVGDLITRLDEDDFEIFVALALERAGWRRVSPIGGQQEDIDFALVQPLWRERAGVQVKSRAGAARLRACAERILARGYDRAIVACHTIEGAAAIFPAATLLLDRAQLARLGLEAGLLDWLEDKTRGLAAPR